MKTVIDKALCTGCAACYTACPNGSITMIKDAEGFLYPRISEDCINCGKCQRVCPRINAKKNAAYDKKVFAATSKNFNVWKRSSSGGAFSEICYAWGDEETLVCGAAWDKLDVYHLCVLGTSKIAPLCKSKYISSDIKDSYKEIKKHLEQNKRAIFCGTPCQVAGLKSFLNKEYDNLLMIDLICHGVGSPKVFDECVKLTEKDVSHKISSYEFRSKQRVFDRDHIVRLEIDGQKSPQYIVEDRYLQLFVKQDCLRSSCGENCIYRNEARQGDITIGDFKGLFKVFPHLKGTKKNYSTIVINTTKAESILGKLKRSMEMLACSIDDIKEHNPLIYRHTYFSKDRVEFFSDFVSNPVAAIEKRTVPTKVYKKSINGKIFDILPVFVRRRIFERRT